MNHRDYFPKQITIVPQFQVYSSMTQAKQIINLLLLNHFYSVIYRRVQKESDELLYTVWSLVMVRNQLPEQVVNLLRREFFVQKLQYFLSFKYI